MFLSHSSADKPLMRRLNRRLKMCGAQTFLDEDDLKAEEYLPRKFKREIGKSAILLVVWTDNAARSPWVRQEIEFAAGKWFRKPRVLACLFSAPKGNVHIENTKGEDFTDAFGFEAAFEKMARRLGIFREATREQLREMITESVAEDPNLAALPSAYRPGDVTVSLLPAAGTAKWATLDGLMWALAKGTSDAEARLRWPEILARCFAASGAGYEALELLLRRNGGMADMVPELIARNSICDVALEPLMRLAEQAPDAPGGWGWGFVRENHDRLPAGHFHRLLRMVGDAPGSGSPSDLLQELCARGPLKQDAMRKLGNWIEKGLYDAVDPARGADAPYICLGMVAGLEKASARKEAGELMEMIYERVKRLFRSAQTEQICAALSWLAGGDRLPAPGHWSRLTLQKAFQDGVYSAEFEQWAHAKVGSTCGLILCDALFAPDREMDDARREIEQRLANIGIAHRV
jgi:hypothetical protein